MAAESGIPDERIFLGGSDGRPKMSEILTEWAEPIFEDQRSNLREFAHAVKFAAVIWNAATARSDPPDVVADWVLEAALAAGVPHSAEIHVIVSDLVSSRRDFYGADPRVIIDTEVLQGDGEFRLNVASSYPAPRA
ncbi:MAG: hypothetical protein JNL79_00605 [Myxococcales bacterium]|nr:hypothetical protein [Myxococcales bacterium]